jgi:1,2-diacylglycerol 3-beta-galactosyltransferase
MESDLTSPKRILILTANAGFGHRSASTAVEAALLDKYAGLVDVTVINPLDHKRTPAWLRDSQYDYDFWVKQLPELYRLGYEASDERLPTAIVSNAVGIVLIDVLREIIRDEHPDAILCTYPLYLNPLATLLSRNSRRKIPFYTTITDLVSVHRIWFSTKTTGTFVPTNIVRDMAIDSGVHADRIYITGIPVSPNIAKLPDDKNALREKLGLHKDLTTILAVGSKRVENLVETLNVVNHFGSPLQLVVAAGGDTELFKTLTEIEWHIPVKLFEYVDDMPPLLGAADITIAKAGGLSVSESMACGLPMILINVLPGQEAGNADYVTQNGIGDIAENPMQVLEILAHWLIDDGRLMKERAAKSRQFGRPNAAYDIADKMWEASHHVSAVKPRRRGSSRNLRISNIVNLDEHNPENHG